MAVLSSSVLRRAACVVLAGALIATGALGAAAQQLPSGEDEALATCVADAAAYADVAQEVDPLKWPLTVAQRSAFSRFRAALHYMVDQRDDEVEALADEMTEIRMDGAQDDMRDDIDRTFQALSAAIQRCNERFYDDAEPLFDTADFAAFRERWDFDLTLPQ